MKGKSQTLSSNNQKWGEAEQGNKKLLVKQMNANLYPQSDSPIARICRLKVFASESSFSHSFNKHLFISKQHSSQLPALSSFAGESTKCYSEVIVRFALSSNNQGNTRMISFNSHFLKSQGIFLGSDDNISKNIRCK